MADNILNHIMRYKHRHIKALGDAPTAIGLSTKDYAALLEHYPGKGVGFIAIRITGTLIVEDPKLGDVKLNG